MAEPITPQEAVMQAAAKLKVREEWLRREAQVKLAIADELCNLRIDIELAADRIEKEA